MVAEDNGLITEGRLERRETRWPAFARFQETENLFILYEGARLMRLSPKRAFSGPELDEFRQLLNSKITR